MNEQERTEQQPAAPPTVTGTSAASERYPELAELQRDIERCLKDNQKFLDHFLDDDFLDEPEDDSDDFDGTMEPEL